MGLFTRRRKPVADLGGLGIGQIALRLADGELAPAPCTVVVFSAGGHARRLTSGRVACGAGETAYCFHPGPYSVDLTPFAAAPEWGLRLRFVVDAANPRVAQQRFDLYLFSEAQAALELDGFGSAIGSAVQVELAQGRLELPPCTSLDEWHAFRAGLNQLLYTRFGVTVDDCVPVDRGDVVDFARTLRERAAQMELRPLPAAADESAMASQIVVAAPEASTAMAPQAGAHADAQALRRLFLELPALSGGYRLLPLPPGRAPFQFHQALLQRVGLISLGVATMPSLAWAAPDQPLDAVQQSRRRRHSVAACVALDEMWALLARLQLAQPEQWTALMDEADRLCANLEHSLAQRRAPFAPLPDDERREPEPAAHRKEPT